ncbi:hypothetical protein MATL_G00227120 [Megalops atlanticus]|uniref:Uncharacterized protein n=1 Tax=Megalops atlanticus TaxID=7932 RepID=A0A9D3PCY7_MEGAT|nr:hypothetical protein MATL_G00227120 [Megalops atlanticus]
MSYLFCCCASCFSDSEDSVQSNAERQPLLPPESARLFHPPAQDVAKLNGKLSVKLVGVPELDGHFADIAETFNQQQEHYESMLESLGQLRASCGHGGGLSDCLHRLQAENSTRQLSVQMKGYEFSLEVSGEVPPELQRAQESVSSLCQAVKAITAAGPRLQGMIRWLLQSEEQLRQRVTDASPNFQQQLRVQANLRENLQGVRRVQVRSAQYREEAGAVLSEAAKLAETQS